MDLSGALKYLSQIPIKVKLQLLRKYQNICQNIPNYQKVTNLKKTQVYCAFFSFSMKFLCFVMGVPSVPGCPHCSWQDKVQLIAGEYGF